MEVCIVGCGAAGLAALRRALESSKLKTTAFERASQVGGTWVYDEAVGVAEDGLPVHSSMYKGLRTNLPKEVMGYPDFPIGDEEESYVTQKVILRFLNNYADAYHLREHIKFNHVVKSVRPTNGNKWQVDVWDSQADIGHTLIFDAVIICNGHYHTPHYPEIKGRELFAGETVHSHDYRDPDRFAGSTVVVIGAGPSGMDIALQLAQKAGQVYLSHRLKMEPRTDFPKNVSLVPGIVEISPQKVILEDSSALEADVLLYCTGYDYSFPFLHESCGIRVDDNHVTPLYKHLVNIERPTMCFVGLPYYVCAFQMFDLQVRYFLKVLTAEVELPDKETMRSESRRDESKRNEMGLHKRQYHMMGNMQSSYYKDLAESGKISPLPPVMASIHGDSSQRFLDDLTHFRKDKYSIVDDENFIRT